MTAETIGYTPVDQQQGSEASNVDNRVQLPYLRDYRDRLTAYIFRMSNGSRIDPKIPIICDVIERVASSGKSTWEAHLGKAVLGAAVIGGASVFVDKETIGFFVSAGAWTWWRAGSK